MIFQVAEWGEDGLHVKRLAIDEDPALWRAYAHLTTLVCQYAFGVLPAKIEWIGLMSGKHRVYRPQPEDVGRAEEYLAYVQSGMEKWHTESNQC